jgi:uncharacterized PurR-regulated membrane protein YhhQ (DUF165 family)
VIYLVISLYAAAMTAANLLVVHFGPEITPVNAFFLIGMELSLRDWLNVRLKPWQMGALIAGTSLLSWALDPSAQQIAIASACAFLVSSMGAWMLFTVAKGTWLARSLKANTVGAALDSLVFPLMAFGAFLPLIMLAQFAAKMAGGAVWAYMISRSNATEGVQS